MRKTTSTTLYQVLRRVPTSVRETRRLLTLLTPDSQLLTVTRWSACRHEISGRTKPNKKSKAGRKSKVGGAKGGKAVNFVRQQTADGEGDDPTDMADVERMVRFGGISTYHGDDAKTKSQLALVGGSRFSSGGQLS